jgi:catechol 2,3-dioxygenase-like lactoylglutathione lyase family enzyme
MAQAAEPTAGPHFTISETRSETTMEMRLEVVPVPVADVERAKAFYADQMGFDVDHDTRVDDTTRFVQLTPPGSGCSIVIGTGMGEISEMVPGSLKQLHLVVPDLAEVKELLSGRGVDVSDIVEYPRGIKFAYFRDPDGNSWALQEIPPDLHER